MIKSAKSFGTPRQVRASERTLLAVLAAVFLQLSCLEPGFEPLVQKLIAATIQIFWFG
jgi:hypothetical protein